MTRQAGRRLNPVLWALVVLITAWVAVVLAAEFNASRHSSGILLSLPFLVVVVIGTAAYFMVEGHLADLTLRHSVQADLKEARNQSLRLRDLAARLEAQSRAGRSQSSQAASGSSAGCPAGQ